MSDPILDVITKAIQVAAKYGQECPSGAIFDSNDEVVSYTQVVSRGTSTPMIGYADDHVAIFMSQTNGEMEIIVQHGVHPNGIRNPAIMINADGDVYRYHGEAVYVLPRLEALLKFDVL